MAAVATFLNSLRGRGDPDSKPTGTRKQSNESWDAGNLSDTRVHFLVPLDGNLKLLLVVTDNQATLEWTIVSHIYIPRPGIE
jgi:hypothetical protein